MHKIIMNDDEIYLDKDNKLDIKENSSVTLYLKESGNIEINIDKNSNVTIYHLGVDISNEIVINLNGENSNLLYHYNVINYNNNKLAMTINHNSDNTTSNVHNHGVNIKDKLLEFNITGVVKKDIKNCICNQENRIINPTNNNSIIKPNLLIDSYDTISSHSAYIGKFSDDILFYLMSRGLDIKKAYKMLIKAYLIPNNIDENKIKDFLKQIEKI